MFSSDFALRENQTDSSVQVWQCLVLLGFLFRFLRALYWILLFSRVNVLNCKRDISGEDTALLKYCVSKVN